MKRLLSSLLVLAIASSAFAQTTPAPITVPKVIFPTVPVPTPPAPVPGLAQFIGADQQYIIQASAPIIVLASPAGVVKITPEKGPLRIRGKFVDATGTETRTFLEPNIYIVEASGSGVCELIVVKSMDPKTVERITLTTDIKPPEPDPGPGPGPDPKPPAPGPAPIPVDGFRALLVFEKTELNKLPASQLNAVYSEKVRAYLQSHCVASPDGKTKEFRYYDQNDNLANDSKVWQDAFARPRTKVPWIVLSNGKTGYEGPVPLTEAELLQLLTKYGGA